MFYVFIWIYVEKYYVIVLCVLILVFMIFIFFLIVVNVENCELNIEMNI